MSQDEEEVLQEEQEIEEIFVSGEANKYARETSRMAVVLMVVGIVLMFIAIAFNNWILNKKNMVAAVPYGNNYEYPMVHWMNVPNQYEENAKMFHVALKYVRGLYEFDPIDFSLVELGTYMPQVGMSKRINELLGYTVPGTIERIKIKTALETSQKNYQMFLGCNCVKRFLISDIMVWRSTLPTVRVEIIGKFVIFSRDTRVPVPAEDLGLKSIVLYMSNDIPLFDRNVVENFVIENQAIAKSIKEREAEEESEEETKSTRSVEHIKSRNPEAWFVIRSDITQIQQADLNDLRKIRKSLYMKAAY